MESNPSLVASAILHLIQRFAEDQLGKDAKPFVKPLRDLSEIGLNQVIAEFLTERYESPGLKFRDDS